MIRYTVTNSTGSRNGNRFGVWDKETRTVVAYHRTFRTAQKDAMRRNERIRNGMADR